MARKKLVPITNNELRYILKKDPKFRSALKRLRLKLTASGRLVGSKRDGCAPADFKPGRDPLILERGASKRRK